VYDGHTDVVCALVSAGAYVNLQRKDGTSPLMTASRKGHLDIVITLLDNNAYTESRNHNGCTALWLAASNGHTDVVDDLLARGADINSVNYMRRMPVYAAAVEGHIDTVNTLLCHNAVVTHEDGDCADALSHVAVWGKREVEAMLRLLMNNGAYVDPGHNCDNETALISAVYSGRRDVVDVIVEYGADLQARNDDNLQPIDIAGYCGYVDIVGYLRDNFPLHCREFSTSFLSSYTSLDCHCNTALHLTTDLQHMRILLADGADTEAENVDGLRPIHCAVRTGLVELVELLIQRGANVDAADAFGNRQLHEAACRGLDFILQSLVQHGAKINIQNNDGKTPLHIAVEHEQSDIVAFFLKEGAGVTLTDVWRNTPMHYLTAQLLANHGVMECIIKQTENCRHLSIHNALNVSALSHMIHCGILDYLNHRQEFLNGLDKIDTCSEKLIQLLKTTSKSEVYTVAKTGR